MATNWTFVAPSNPGAYWYRIPGPNDDALDPDTWTDVRIKLWTRHEIVKTLGSSIQFWSVPVEPPSAPDPLDPDWDESVASFEIPSSWISVGERLPESDGWYHVAVHDYKGRYPRHAVAEFTRDRFWIADDNGEGDSVFAWRGPALPPLPVAEVEE